VPEKKSDLVIRKWLTQSFSLLYQIFQGPALNVLHLDDEALIGFDERVKFNDVFMVDCC
jgi:hypothetical protein